MINLTREEAQQVLDAFLGIGQRAYDAVSGDAFHECSIAVSRLRARLSAPEPDGRKLQKIRQAAWKTVRDEYKDDPECCFALGFDAGYDAVARRVEPPVSESGAGFESLPASPVAQPEPEPVTDKYLMEVECTKCGAKQDGVLTVTVPPQPEPPCKTGSQCIGGKCPQCVVSEPEPVAWMNEGDMGRTDWKVWAHGKPTATIPLYTAPSQREEGCAECGKKSSDGWALYCVKCSEREWQGLTEAERLDILDAEITTQSTEHFALARAIEAKLKEKNT